MNEKSKQFDVLSQMDSKEVTLPETTYVRDIETRVFQAITLQCLSKIEGIGLLGSNLIDNLLGREGIDRIKGVHVEQDQKNRSIHIRVEVNVHYGISIPEKAEEIQTKILEEVSSLSGVHVSCVHVIFKNLVLPVPIQKEDTEETTEEEKVPLLTEGSEEEYGDGF